MAKKPEPRVMQFAKQAAAAQAKRDQTGLIKNEADMALDVAADSLLEHRLELARKLSLQVRTTLNAFLLDRGGFRKFDHALTAAFKTLEPEARTKLDNDLMHLLVSDWDGAGGIKFNCMGVPEEHQISFFIENGCDVDFLGNLTKLLDKITNDKASLFAVNENNKLISVDDSNLSGVAVQYTLLNPTQEKLYPQDLTSTIDQVVDMVTAALGEAYQKHPSLSQAITAAVPPEETKKYITAAANLKKAADAAKLDGKALEKILSLKDEKALLKNNPELSKLSAKVSDLKGKSSEASEEHQKAWKRALSMEDKGQKYGERIYKKYVEPELKKATAESAPILMDSFAKFVEAERERVSQGEQSPT
jgi:hypothetical protein